MSRIAAWVLASMCTLVMHACSDDTQPQADAPRPGSDFKAEQPPRTDARVDFYVVPDVGPVPDGLTCKLAVESINKKPVFAISQLSSLDDQDKATPGIQLDVVVSVIGKPDGTSITLQVTGLQPSPTALSAAGKASFTGVTLAPGLTTVTMRPEAAGCAGTASIFNVQLDPSCSFVSPTDGAKLTAANDKIPGNGTFDYDVSIQTQNAAGATVTLFVAGSAVGTPKTPDLSGLALFPGEALATGPSVELKATVAAGFLTAECKITISIDVAKPLCDLGGFNPPAKLTSKGIPGLGPAQDAEPATPKLQTNFTVETAAGVDEVILEVDGVPQTAAPDAVTHKATFKLTLDEGTRNLQATCKNKTTGVENQSPKTAILVDTTPPPAVTDLACTVTNHRAGEITCTWKSVDDGASGSGVEKYQVRYRANSAIDAANFDAPETTKLPDQPAVPTGATQTFKLTKLTMPNTYAEAVKAVDYLGNVSTVSNLPAGQKVDFKVQEIVGKATGSFFGSTVVVADFNCDKYTDLAVGLSGANSNKGEVQIFFSSGAGLPQQPSKRIQGTLTAGFLGNQLVALDHDGDGCADIAVRGAASDGLQGAVLVYLGQQIWSDRDDYSQGKGADLVFRLPATAGATERIGLRLGAADMNGDGRDDLAMSHWITDGSMWSSVWVKYGQANIPRIGPGISPSIKQITTEGDLHVVGGKYSERFAYTIRRGGLLNADPYEELLVAAEYAQVGGKQTGAVYVIMGAQSGATKPETLDVTASLRANRVDGGPANSSFGLGLAGIGDTNGDGVAEIAIGDLFKASSTEAAVGEAYVFTLSPTIPKSVIDARAVLINDLTPAANSWFGRTIAPGADLDAQKGADLDGDGLADMVVGMAINGASGVGAARLFRGSPGAHSNRTASSAHYVFTPPPGGTTGFSFSLFLAGDLNGDGYPDIVAGEFAYLSNTGRVAVFY